MADISQYDSEDKDWQFDFSGELLDDDTISAVVEVVSDDSDHLAIDQVSVVDDKMVWFKLSGGEPGHYYTVTATVASEQGRTLTMKTVAYIKI